jgi:hypothetical protein
MKLSYVIHNQTDNDFPLEPNEAWKFIVEADDEYDSYMQMEKVKMAAQMHRHTILNVYLDGKRFDAREYWTEGANSDDFDYDDSIQISQLRDETTPRR